MEAPDTRAYVLLDDENAVVEAIQADFKGLADALIGDALLGESPIASAHLGEPKAYGGLFPAWVFYRIVSRGQSRNSEAAEKMLAEEYVCQLVILERATSPDGGETSGRGYADARTTRAFGAWVDLLARTPNGWTIQGRATGGIERVQTATGSFTEYGRPMFVDEQDNILWAHSSEWRVVL